jgi:hypothetical protein
MLKKLIFVSLILIDLGKLSFAAELKEIEIKKGLIFTVDQKNLPAAANWIWDNFRAWRISYMNFGRYENVYYAVGEQCRDDNYMKDIWQRALLENDVVDYVSMVHGGDQWIKDEWDLPKGSGKLRMVYSEGCQGGSGKEGFVEKYNACVAAGHNKDTSIPSASPFFSFRFLDSWLSGKSFKKSLENAWEDGKEALRSPGWFLIAKHVGGYNNCEDAIQGSKIQYSYRENYDVNTFTIDSHLAHSEEEDVIESEINDQ